MSKADWKLIRNGRMRPGMSAAQMQRAGRRLAGNSARGIRLRYDLDLQVPDRGGTYWLCPQRCGWRRKLTGGNAMRRFRQHWALCPRRPKNRRREIPPLKNPPVIMRPDDSPVGWDRNKRRRPVETVELPA